MALYKQVLLPMVSGSLALIWLTAVACTKIFTHTISVKVSHPVFSFVCVASSTCNLFKNILCEIHKKFAIIQESDSLEFSAFTFSLSSKITSEN